MELLRNLLSDAFFLRGLLEIIFILALAGGVSILLVIIACKLLGKKRKQKGHEKPVQKPEKPQPEKGFIPSSPAEAAIVKVAEAQGEKIAAELHLEAVDIRSTAESTEDYVLEQGFENKKKREELIKAREKALKAERDLLLENKELEEFRPTRVGDFLAKRIGRHAWESIKIGAFVLAIILVAVILKKTGIFI